MSGMATRHISEDKALQDMAGLLASVRAGQEIVIENDPHRAVLLKLAENERPRLLSESLRMARERNNPVLLDDEFGDDVEAAIASRPEPLSSPWD